ncbi:Ger(x)C family spore germination protein [Aquibacillus halophilus]|uniref:Ger(X)C family spore germination protein n=1 Tax=Aquibacillus halophilus TaxID=930132 RepID=A0A6A8DKT3_9BACI|nr:Ger(x)C family spore germination protein [Aquibacillus halophilus]MRH45086.1 Ger(x)C family spore germination protein [Aquibacillus halophilus]
MNQKVVHLLCIVVLCISLTGCWSSRELSELAIATALGIDKHEDGYKLTVQIMNPGEIAGRQLTTRAVVTTYSTTGKTIFEALRRLTTITPRKIYLAHLRIIIFGQELMEEEGLANSLDFISRDHELRTDFSLAIAKDMSAEDLIKVLTPIEKVPADKIFSSLKTSQDNWAPTKVVMLDELISSLTSPGKQAVLTGLYISGKPETGNHIENVQQVDSPAKVHLDHIGVFKGDKLVGWLNESESKGFNYITDNVLNTVGWVECDQTGTISVEVFKSNTKLTGLADNGTPKITIDVKSEASIGEVACQIDINDEKKLTEIEQKLEKKIEEIVNGSIAKAKEFNSDIFGFGDVLRRFEPKKWETWKENWSEEFQNIEITVNADMKIRRTGTTTESFIGKIEQKKEKDE